jgi:hypothetical protein
LKESLLWLPGQKVIEGVTRVRSESSSYAKRLRAPFPSQQNSGQVKVGFATESFHFVVPQFNEKVIADPVIIALLKLFALAFGSLARLDLLLQTCFLRLSGLRAILPFPSLRHQHILCSFFQPYLVSRRSRLYILL